MLLNPFCEVEPDMSMPDIPDFKLDRCQSANLLLTSIGLEEVSLSHLMNAEAEKLQFALGTLHPGAKPCDCKQVLEVNESIRRTMRSIMMTEMLLSMKLEDAAALSCCKEKAPRCEGGAE